MSTPEPSRGCLRCGGEVPRIEVWNYTLPLYYCPTCTPIVEQEECEQERRKLATDLLGRANGGHMRGWSFANYPDDIKGREAKAAALAWFKSWLIGGAGNLLIFGPIGTGKSSLAWSIVRAACEQGHDAMFVTFREYLWDLKRSYSDPEWKVDERCHWVGLLALDDVGAERPTEHARDELSSLIEHRRNRSLATVVTSNYAPGELVARLGRDDEKIGRRIVSRLVEGATQLRVEGADRRLAA